MRLRVAEPLRNAVHRARCDTRPNGELVDTLSDRSQILDDLHAESMPRFRGSVNPEFEGIVIPFPVAHHFPMGKAMMSLADVVFETLFGLVERDGQAATLRRAGIAQGTFDRWQKARAEGLEPGLNRANFEALCRLPEVRAALASALLRRADENATAWEAIAGELSRLMDATTGWDLVKKLSAMRDLGLLDGGLSALDGMVTARRRAHAEMSQHANHSDSKAKQKK